MIVDATIAFFVLGLFASLVRAEIQFPKSLYQTLVLFLMLAIGLKGGVALAEHASWALLSQSALVIILGLVLPFIAFPILYFFGDLPRSDSASIAAHYGSVSVGTYAVAVAFLESQKIPYEPYIPLFVVLLEMPAIAVGIFLARRASHFSSENADGQVHNLFREIFLNQGMVLMIGGLLIGYMAGAEGTASIAPFFFTLFGGALALFLLEMGMVAGRRLSELRQIGSFMLAFGVSMPIIGGLLGCLLGIAIGLSQGGAILLAVLGASASYIAVPAAMRVALPEANHGLSISSSLGVTFPFNVLIGIPLYTATTQWIVGAAA